MLQDLKLTLYTAIENSQVEDLFWLMLFMFAAIYGGVMIGFWIGERKKD